MSDDEVVRYRIGKEELASLERRTTEYESQMWSGTPLAESALAYLRGRGFEDATIRNFRLGLVESPIEGDGVGRGRIAIPYLSAAGPRLFKFRAIGQAERKILALSGTRNVVFNSRRIADRGHQIAITEGEFDTCIAEQCGIDSVGIPGVANWKPHWYPLFAGYDLIRILADGDDPGETFADTLAGQLSDRGLNVQVYSMPKGMDVNEVFQAEGRNGLRERCGLKPLLASKDLF